jgi:hypothetical protein
MPVYDDERTDKPLTDPLEESFSEPAATGKDLPVSHPHQDQDIKALEEDFARPPATDNDLPDGHPDKLDPEDLENMEEDAGDDSDDTIGEGYKEEPVKRRLRIRGLTRKRGLFGGGVIGGLIATIVIGFFLLLPYKIVAMFDKLQKHFYTSVESALDKRSDTIVSHYIKSKVLPGLNINDCPSTRRSRSCVAAGTGVGKVSRLYQAWRDNNFEGKLATKYGLEFGVRGGGNYYVVTPNTRRELGLGTSSNGFRTSDQNIFEYISQMDRSSAGEVRRAAKNALDGEVFYKRVVYRFKVGRLLERKYGVKRCVTACNLRDDFSAWKTNKKKAAQMLLVQRVITPRSERTGLIIQCLLIGGCDGTAGRDTDGQNIDRFEQQVRESLQRFAQTFGEEAVEDIIHNANLVLEKGVEQYVIEKVLTRFVSQTAADSAGKTIPFIGWVDLADTVVTRLGESPGLIKKMTYVTNATAMVSVYMMYRTHADEIKSGTVDTEMVGSFTNMLGDVGNGGSAEASPLYANIIKTESEATAFDSLFPSVYAQETQTVTQTSAYICNDKKPVPAGKLICPEDDLDGSSTVTRALDAVNTTLAPVRAVLNIYGQDLLPVPGNQSVRSVFRGLTSWTGEAISAALSIPPFSSIYNQILEGTEGLQGIVTDFLIDILIPSPFPDKPEDTSGAKMFTLAGGGADVSANDYAHYGLGGRKLTDQEVAAIRSEQELVDMENFKNKPLYARIFDTTDSMSLVSKVALSLPAPDSAPRSFLGFLQHPFSKLSTLLTAAFSSQRVGAATISPDPFHVSQYGFPSNSSELSLDPETYDDAQCQAQEEAWEASAIVPDDSTSGMPEHTTTSICKLDEAVIAGLGGIYDQSLIGEGGL